MRALILLFFLTQTASAFTNKIIAVVNDEIITSDSIKDSNGEPRVDLLNKQIGLILQLQKIKKIGVSPKLDIVKSALNEIALKNNINPNEIFNSPKYKNLRQQVVQQLSISGLRHFVLKNQTFSVSQAEVDDAIATKDITEVQTKIAQIVINDIDKSSTFIGTKDEAIQYFLIKLAIKIEGGADFAALAKQHSQDYLSYKNGGEIDWQVNTKIPSIIRQNLQKDEISSPIKFNKGWRIVKIIDQREIEPNQEFTRQKLLKEKRQKHFNDWIETLRKKAYIEIY